MDNSTCQRISFDFSGRFLPPVYTLVFVVGLAANGWGLKSLLHNWKKLGNVNVFVLNLGLTDILYLLTLPFLVVYYVMKSKWIFGEVFCKITRFFFNLNLYGSIWFLTCISVYRYLAIVHPMRAMGRITVKHSVTISVLVWSAVGALSLPDMFYPKHSRSNNQKCYDTTSNIHVEDYQKYVLGWTLFGFCVPLLITLGCYGHMIVVICRTDTTDKVLKQKILRLLFILILLFSVCYIPYHVLKNLNLLSRVLRGKRVCHGWFNGVYIARQISRGLVSLNSALNPLVYLQGHENIKSSLRQLLRRVQQMFGQLSSSHSRREEVTRTTNDI